MPLVQIQHRFDTAAAWSSANPVLLTGELGINTTNGRLKTGDGVTSWNSLAYDATKILASVGTPSAGTGVDGDYAIDKSNMVLYGPKAAGSWTGTGTTMVGPQGIQGVTGNTGANGAGVPAGGATDNFLLKIDGTNYNTSWRTAAQVAAILPAATTGAQGLLTPAEKTRLGNAMFGYANVLDYGADPTGVAAYTVPLNNALAALTGGGIVYHPPGVYLENTTPYVVSANNIVFAGAGENATTIKTTNTTGDQLRFTGYGCKVKDMMIQGPGSVTTSSKTSGIGLDMQSTEGEVLNTSFTYQASCLRVGGPLVDVESIYCRYWTLNGIVVDHQSDHRITKVVMDNAAATLPTGAGIQVTTTASLVLEQLNIIHSNWGLNLSPGAGITIPSVKATDCFFDTSAIGLRMAGAGSVFRSEFTNCWFSSMTQYGILMAPSTAGTMIDGITFVNCDVYNNIGGTTVGVAVTTANVGKWKMMGCSIAGWTDGIALVGGAAHYPTLIGNTIGAVSAFTANGTGIRVAAGTYKGLVMLGNDCNDNTAVLALGAVTAAAWANYRIVDNPGINPRGAVTPPIATPVTATTYTNNTGFRCNVNCRGATMTAGPTVNGVAAAGAGVASAWVPITLEPGATIALAGTTLVWFWAGM